MVGLTLSQRTKLGIPTESRLALIRHSDAEFVFSQNIILFSSPIAKLNSMFSHNSMIIADMELFIYSV